MKRFRSTNAKGISKDSHDESMDINENREMDKLVSFFELLIRIDQKQKHKANKRGNC